jgi:hypothetical protein
MACSFEPPLEKKTHRSVHHTTQQANPKFPNAGFSSRNHDVIFERRILLGVAAARGYDIT